MSKNSEKTGRSATKPKVTNKATAKQKAPAQKTSNSAVTKGAAAKKTSTTEKAGPKAAGQKKSVAKKSVAKQDTRKAAQRILASERHQMIAEAAYLRAEAQGFISDQREDWLMAEAEVDARLAKAGWKIVN